ncbi:MAG: hypothetical protein ACRECN_02595 [Methylocella sp.]
MFACRSKARRRPRPPAADQGHGAAQCFLGLLYEQGRGGLSTNDREAARLYKLAADQGHAEAKAALTRLG